MSKLWFASVPSLVALVLAIASPAGSQDIQGPSRAEPEGSSPRVEKALVRGRSQMVVTAHPLASKAGRQVLREGGNALDAAIAVQMVLNLVEPQSSGIGGGAFLLYWDAKSETLTAYDGRETAPAAAMPGRFLDSRGSSLPFGEASTGGLAVGVPGALRMLELAHRQHGRLAWQLLLEPAIALAEAGFPVTRRLHDLLRRAGADRFNRTARSYFFDQTGKPHAPGHRLRNGALAETLRTVAEHGADGLYTGPVARDIVRTVRKASRMPDHIALRDLSAYAAKTRRPVCGPYRRYRVCGMGPPSSGGLTVLQTLMMLSRFDLGSGPEDVRALHLIAEAEKLAYADRARYIADSDFVPVPKGLIDPDYLRARSWLIAPNASMGRAKPGDPPEMRGVFGASQPRDEPGTSHISIIDAQGNAVSMTSSIERAFGSGLMVRGFLLNNQLTDFSFQPMDSQGRPIANRVEAGKRPRSSMAPTIVFDEGGAPFLVTGSPGGSRIILYVLKSLIAVIDWKLNAQQAASLPNFGSRNGPFELERGDTSALPIERLRQYGHTLSLTPMTSGLHIIVLRDDHLEGGADPRRDGVALGE